MNYWNALEHFVNIYWSNKNKTTLISKSKLKKLNDCVKKLIGSFKQEDILFPALSINDLKNGGYLRVDRRVPIKDKVFSLIDILEIEKNLDLNEIMNLIRKVYYIRNILFHAHYYLEDILEKYKENFKCPKFIISDFGGIILHDFEKFLDFLILKYFNIQMYYLVMVIVLVF